jgi:hypothetical protein
MNQCKDTLKPRLKQSRKTMTSSVLGEGNSPPSTNLQLASSSSARYLNPLDSGYQPNWQQIELHFLSTTISGPGVCRHIVGPMLRRRRSYRKKQSSAGVVCIKWPKVPLCEASVLQTDLEIE